MRLIQEIGSYAGLAAIPGLAILSALYFSQARDVRRLREWAGRAPERSAEIAQGGRVAARPAEQPAVAQPGAQPAAAPAAAAASTGAAAASAGGGGTATAAPPRTTPAAAGGPPRVAPRVPGARPPGSQTSILSPGAKEPDPWYRRFAARLPAGRYIAIILVGIAVVGGGIAYGITQLSSDSSTDPQQSAKSPAAKHGKKSKPAAISPGDVSVSVLNATTVTGLARTVGSKLEQQGFDVINKDNSQQGQLAESVVQFKPGANRDAALVADKLGISNIEPGNAATLAQGGGSKVVVVIGADLARGQ